MEKLVEKWAMKIYELSIGATSEEGGTRSKKVTIGGETTLPFLHFEGEIPHPPQIAVEVRDFSPEEDWPYFSKELGEIVKDPYTWAKKAEEWGADLICLKLLSCHPDRGNNSPQYAGETVKRMLETTSLPLIVVGCGQAEKDGEILLAASEAGKGERLLLGMATKDNYRTVTAACLSGEHNIIAESPLDINLAKQLNILISDMGLPLERIVIHPTTGGLGYGFEYCYSIMERTRLAGLGEDKTMAMPIINMIAQETWKLREAVLTEEDEPSWGKLKLRAPAWEIACASAYLQGGADILVVAHPQTVKYLKKIIATLMKKEK